MFTWPARLRRVTRLATGNASLTALPRGRFRASQRRRTRRDFLETLEQRALLAGDVVANDWISTLVEKLAPMAATAQPITINSTLPISNGYRRSTVNTVSLTGTADPSATLITVGGQQATWNQAAGTWSINNLPLNPGINRIVARAYQDPGTVLNETFIDIWYDISAVGVNVPTGSIWKYHDQGQNLGTAWKEESYPAASTWPQGAGELGYGESDQSPTGTIGFGGDPNNVHITSYFRHQFTIPAGGTAGLTQASVSIKYDDGAVVYINGTEIGRPDMPPLPTVINSGTVAAVRRENQTATIPFSPSLLHEGVITIAVEVHQRENDSTDLSFDLSLSASNGVGTGTNVAGTLPAGTTTWTAEQGPYTVTGDIVVPTGATLVIEPGTTVFFNGGTGITVNGRLLAEGTDAERIRFTRIPGGARWDGIEFTNTLQDNRMTFFVQEYGDQQGHSIGVDASKLTVDEADWAFANRTVIEVDHPSLLVKNSHFPAIGGGEVVHGEHITGNEYLILDGNLFDKGTSSDDIVDFLGSDRPGPVFQVLNNIFMGGNDDGIDLDGTDAHVEGNIFTGFHLNTSRPTTSNAIATGLPQSGETNRTQITVVRNLFYDNDHGVLLKEDAFGTIVNNVFADITLAGIQVHELGGTAVGGPGRGAYLDGNIFYNVPELIKNEQPDTELVVNRSIVPAADIGRGVGNLAVDPLFVDPNNRDYRLQINSPARGTGPNGVDMGAYVPPGASISGEPSSPTTNTSATLTVGGPDIYGYRYRVNDGPWSSEVATQNVETINPVVPPIVLTNLTPGAYRVRVIAKNSAGVWQAEDGAAVSDEWLVVAENASVVGRHIFYNQSKFDGNLQAADANDDNAIATDKTALLPGQTSSFANYTSYNKGINGIMIDIADLAGVVTPNDFELKVGNSDTPDNWAPLSDPPFVFTRPGDGVDDSTRVTLIIRLPVLKQWLQVTVKANENTGLVSPDVFYFGNAVGESGNVPGDYSVSITDELLARNNPVGINPGATVTSRFDYNRDGTVSVVDQLLARNNITTAATRLKQITVPSTPPSIELVAEGLQEVIAKDEAATPVAASAERQPLLSVQPARPAPHASLDENTTDRLPARAAGAHQELSDELLALIARR